MPIFIVNDSHLQRLSPAARRELLQILSSDIAEAKTQFADLAWDPEGNESYPLSVEEAELLISGMPERACNALRVFAENFDGNKGTATFQQLLQATGHTKYENVGGELAWILLRVRTVTGHPDAWIVTWRTKDWKWDEHKQTYTKGKYFITGEAIASLREAIGIQEMR
ncbi:MAG: hypothetical protein ACE5NW_17140 [Acidiferrobacterales bacterium]